MKLSTLTMLLALTPLAVACAPEESEAEDAAERTGVSESPLLGSSKLLWPMQNGKATIKVCWLPVDLGGEVAPGGQFAADFAKVLPERKKWLREGVEREWNGKTVVQFVGWEDCGAAGADVSIQPVSRLGSTPNCTEDGKGGNCVEKIGAPVRGKRVFINLLFGDEALAEARYLQSVGTGKLDTTKLLPTGGFSPAICGSEMAIHYDRYNAKQLITDADIAGITRVYKDCVQNVSNHEFGHLAGFSHEQQRTDTSAACRAQYAAAPKDSPSDEDSPLGAFEEDSIMSYCRTTLPGTLTAQDIEQTNAFYRKTAPKLPDTEGPLPDETSPEDAGADSGDAGKKPKPPKKPSAPVSTGGCNG